MFGTPCWFRVKVGEWAIDALGISDQVTFYGNLEDGTRKIAEDCLKTADIIDAALTNPTTPDRVKRYVRDGRPVSKDEEDVKDLVDANIAVAAYESWWLRWVSNECDGPDCWYQRLNPLMAT